MSDAMDIPDPDGIAEILEVKVSPLRLERDEALREQVEILGAKRVLRRLSEAVHQYLAFPREILFDQAIGWIMLREGGKTFRVEFKFTDEHGADRYHFTVAPREKGLKYDVRKKSKDVAQPWGNGTVAPEVRERLLPVIRKHPVVWQLSEKMVRVVEKGELDWEWQPLWNLRSVPIPNRDGALSDVLKGKDKPRYVILATWAFSLEEHEWGGSGHRVQMMIDPRSDDIIEAWEDEWYALY
jgi:hypothetical protein